MHVKYLSQSPQKYCLFLKIIISEWRVCFIPIFIFQTFTAHFLSNRSHAIRCGYSCMLSWLCLSPAISSCIEILPGSDFAIEQYRCGPKRSFSKTDCPFLSHASIHQIFIACLLRTRHCACGGARTASKRNGILALGELTA